jgi:hypothetical protein
MLEGTSVNYVGEGASTFRGNVYGDEVILSSRSGFSGVRPSVTADVMNERPDGKDVSGGQ